VGAYDKKVVALYERTVALHIRGFPLSQCTNIVHATFI